MSVVRSPEHLELALKTAEESMTLLSNRDKFLPLRRDAVHSLAVIGPAGDEDYETGTERPHARLAPWKACDSYLALVLVCSTKKARALLKIEIHF